MVLGLAITLLVWASCVAALVVAGRGSDAKALARFVPDCLLLFHRLLRDERVPRGRKLVLLALVGYLASPVDLIPDFVPVAGQLDDAIVVAVALRFVLRSAGMALVSEHWPGPPQSLSAMLRLASRL